MPRVAMPTGDDAVRLSAAVLKANEWLHTQLIEERAAINKLVELRHVALMKQYEAQLKPLLVKAEPPQPASDEADPGKTGVGPDSVEVEAAAEVDTEQVEDPGNQADGTAPEKPQPVSPARRSGTSTMTYSSVSEDGEVGILASLRRIVLSPQFEWIFGFLIVINSFVMAFSRQYSSFDSYYSLGEPGSKPAEDVWPHADVVFEVLEWVFGLLFTTEVLLKLITLKKKFFTGTLWNPFDLLVVTFWIADRIAFHYPFDPMVLRLVRLARLARLLRVVRWIQFLDPLILMIQSIKASISLLAWALVLMFFLMMISAMFANSLLEPYITNIENPVVDRKEVWMLFGSFSRAFETMFEITIGNWGPPTRLLQNHVSEWWVLAVLLYKLTLGFSVLQVITSVFIQQVFKVASRDEMVMIREKEHAALAYRKNLMNFFKVLDTSGDGMISKDEFHGALSDSMVKHWFAALEVEVHEVDQVFDLLDDGDGNVSQQEFLQGVVQMKAQARHQDLMVINREIKRNRKRVDSIHEKIDLISFQITERKGAEENVSV